MKYLVTSNFTDIHTKKFVQEGTIIELTEERAREIKKAGDFYIRELTEEEHAEAAEEHPEEHAEAAEEHPEEHPKKKPRKKAE